MARVSGRKDLVQVPACGFWETCTLKPQIWIFFVIKDEKINDHNIHVCVTCSAVKNF